MEYNAVGQYIIGLIFFHHYYFHNIIRITATNKIINIILEIKYLVLWYIKIINMF